MWLEGEKITHANAPAASQPVTLMPWGVWHQVAPQDWADMIPASPYHGEPPALHEASLAQTKWGGQRDPYPLPHWDRIADHTDLR